MRKGRQQIELSPAYDLLNTSIILRDPPEELALPIKGKKRKLSQNDLLKYFCQERCGLSAKYMEQMLSRNSTLIPVYFQLVSQSFLSQNRQEAYRDILTSRAQRLGLL
jgi:serine/threonine-protein kinase HipA